MHEVALFVEDSAHRQVIGALVQRLAAEAGVAVALDWRSAVRGHGRVLRELRQYLDDVRRQGGHPELIVVATDANCHGWQERVGEVRHLAEPVAALSPVVLAVPDPHVERWLLLDGAAFKAVFGKGCNAPDLKCDRGRYKEQLSEAIRVTGVEPRLGGIEFAIDLIEAMDIQAAAQQDDSLRHFVEDLRRVFRRWHRT